MQNSRTIKLPERCLDFYSHSDWIELGNRKSYTNLIKPDTLISNIADSETCRSCYGDGCSGNILEAVITQQKLTSGYFGPSKPNGKCSHGGEADLSSWGQGGINKDTPTSSHGHLHEEAALVATNATIELLDDIRAALGDSDFLRLLGLGKTSALCFVIDTTSSMSDDIAKLRKVTSAIINSKKGTAVQPLQYILVTFNDQDYGPLTRTMDPKVFQDEINALIPDGGGDDPEMCLSGLQLALTGSPVQTEIFVFTDADAKDKQLKHDVQALIETKKSVVTFILTRSTSSPSATPLYSQQQVSPQLVDIQLYQDLAQASGGYVIEVTNMNQASNTNEATSNSTMVTLFQTVRNPAKYETFPVFVDFSVQNLIIYIIGNSTDYTITSPTGVSKNSPILQSTETSWPIQGFDNLDIVQPNELEQAGLWHFSINSTQPYTIKVVGQSEIDFLYNFVQLFQGLHSSYAVLNSRPIANSNISLLLSMVGGDNLRPTKVSVVNATSSNYFPGKLVKIGSGQYLVNFSSIPTGEFTIRVDGEASFLSNVILKFQRQSSTRFQTSKVIITAPPSERIEPGKQVTLPFRVATDGSGGRFNIRVSNDHNFDTSFNTSITLESGGSANGTVTLTAPTNASSGTEVSVTIQAEAADGSDFNYVVLRLAVDAPAKDFIPPMCTIVSINADCPGDCRNSSWDLTAEVTGGFGSNIPSVRVLQGNGKLIITSILNDTGIVTTVVYTSSCCFPELELVAIDEVGNVVTCFKSPSAIAASRILTSGVEFFLVLPFKPLSLWLNMGVSLYQFMQL
ncbi:von Willebrand factor A domain-containing protein 7 isoform X2 [Ictalurus punctatus]|uniref:von Willebrand factor A domain-containing protein 7 isoform X2 n=1 Tax=Ictalurus punctatus TaxID=7998 RepID=A0A979ERE5_ICTPU|nr:von Willebrand factor A domain-containing protein 7 isoform X2 [Ictalurus punctatus]